MMRSTKGKIIQTPPSKGRLAPPSTTISVKEVEREKITTALLPSPGEAVQIKVAKVLEENPITVEAGNEASKVVKDVTQSLKSLNELFGLSTALFIFTRRFNELQNHMEFINKSIDKMYMQQNDESEVAVVPAPNASILNSPGAPILSPADQMIGRSGDDEITEETTRSELKYLCETMAGRGVRKYITLHLSDIEKLREEATTALKHAPYPGKLVLDCIGRFYLQGSKAYVKESPMIVNRQASILILEFLLLSDCTNIEVSVKAEAEQASIAWRKRLMSEGGIHKASNADARGLLLFIASYGIPSEFRNDDLIELIQLSNPREISNALRQSSLLVERIPDIIQEMVKKGMGVVAVDVAHSFGVEEKFPSGALLTSFLKKSEEAWKRAKIESQASPVAMKEANEKQLAAFKAVLKCLENYKINPMKVAGWSSIHLKISNLEKEISDLDRIIKERGTLKRKADESNSWNFNSQELKHPHTDESNSWNFNSQELKHPHTANGVSSHAHSNLQVLFGPSGGPFYDAGLSGQLNGYPGAARAGALHRTMTGNVAGDVGALRNDLVHLTRHGTESYPWHGDGALNDNLLRHDLMGPPAHHGRSLFGSALAMEQGIQGQPSTSLGFGNRNPGADLYQFADTVFGR